MMPQRDLGPLCLVRDADQSCFSKTCEAWGGNLASIENDQDWQAVADLYYSYKEAQSFEALWVWLGGFRRRANVQGLGESLTFDWQWLDGSPFNHFDEKWQPWQSRE
eukprot:693292-Rhodomonas_salina.1